MEILNCQGLTCPQPVVEIRNLLAAHSDLMEVTIIVDNPAAAQNVERFLGTQGFQAVIEGAEPVLQVRAWKQGPGNCEAILKKSTDGSQKTLILFTKDTLGQGDDRLGALLLLNFLRTLKEMGETLWRLVFVNGGVKLTIEGAESLPVLQDLEKENVSILVCGTCLNHFGLLDKKQCGETTNMLDIVTSLQVAEKVITF
jgi:selenium metabolism protein YedF